uniref:1-alkyl-2-acetylglycerophosphocholine esterase n=1 Tax=Rhabditophanes sp. KR3021 TaxID=114890 RepID=A0AC35UHF8_9BILA
MNTETIGNNPLWVPRSEYYDGLADYQEMSRFKLKSLLNLLVGQRKISSTWQEPLIEEEEFMKEEGNKKQFPVIVFSHGLSGCRHFYSVYASALASYGYVVASIEHRDLSACFTYKLKYDEDMKHKIEEGMIMKMVISEEADIQFRASQVHVRVKEYDALFDLLDQLNAGNIGSRSYRIVHGDEFDWGQFQSRLDLKNVFLAAHSFGATSSLASLSLSKCFKGAVCLDAWMDPLSLEVLNTVNNPVLFINVNSWQWADNVKRMKCAVKNNKNSGIVSMDGAVHQSFSDFSFLCQGFVGKKAGFQGDVDPIHFGEAATEMMNSYFKSIINGQDYQKNMKPIVERYDFVNEGSPIELDDSPLVSKI